MNDYGDSMVLLTSSILLVLIIFEVFKSKFCNVMFWVFITLHHITDMFVSWLTDAGYEFSERMLTISRWWKARV